MDLSIIIVNWNSLEFTKACVGTIEATVYGLCYEVIVVDNASADSDACRVLPTMFPSVKLVSSDSNIGFARANNLGVDHALGTKILFLNPDTLVLDDAIERMCEQMDSVPNIGAVGCRLLNGDRSLQTSCVQPFPNISNQLFGIEWIKNRTARHPFWGIQALYSETSDLLPEVQVISGACLMVRRELLEKVGRFSTDYFMYAEEADLCHKIQQAGWKICFVGDARIVHFGGQSSKKQSNTFAEVVMRESIFRLLRKFRGSTYAALYRVALLLSALGRVALLFPLLATPRTTSIYESASRSFQKWLKIGRWCVSLEGWAQDLGKQQVEPLQH